MSRSVLLQLARDSIQEVLQAEVTIKRDALIDEHPLLNEKIPLSVSLYIDNTLRGSSSDDNAEISLIDSIILHAKKAAFQDPNFNPLSTSEYLECEIELTLSTPDGIISERDPCIMKTTSFSIENQ